MSMKDHFELLAAYNQKMNAQVYQAAGTLSGPELAMDRGAFFGSILGTLNHIVVGDTIWLKRFASHPASRQSLHAVDQRPHPSSLDQILFADFQALTEHRTWLDHVIIQWVAQLSAPDLDSLFSFRSMKGVPSSKRYSSVMVHFFNHQTHHRGQVSTLLSQAGVDVGTTDLLLLIPEEA